MLGPLFAASLLAGIMSCLWLPSLPGLWWLICIGIAGVMWLRADLKARSCAVFCLGFAWAGVQASAGMSRQLPPAMEHRQVLLTGTVLELPQHEARRTRFVLQVDDAASQPGALRGRRVRLAWYDAYGVEASSVHAPRLRITAGSRWSLLVKLRAPRGLRNPGGVDGEKHALIERIVATGYVRDPQSALELRGPQGIDAWRERMSAKIERAVPQRSSRFLRALAIGDTRALDDDDWERLRAVGLTHLIAISGFHVGLVAGFFALAARGVWWIWPQLGRRWPRPQAAIVAALGGAVLYAALAGFALPTVRTVLMIAVIAIARVVRRGWRPLDAMSLAAIAILCFDPLSVLTAGFWLSFGGVAWLLWCLPHGGAHVLREFFSAQGVATVGLLPLTVALFGQASLAGPFANLLAIPWWSLVVVPLCLIGTGLETLGEGWGGVIWRVAAGAFEPSWSLFSWLGSSPLALWWLPESKWFALPLALVSAFWCLLPRGVPGKSLALLLWLPLLWPDRGLPRMGEAEVVMFDVGQGLSVLVRTAGHTLLYDMGPAVPEGFDAGERAVIPALHALGVSGIDAAVVSHADNDHAGGYAAIAGAYAIGRRYAPAGSRLDRQISGLRACRAGHAWTWDGVRFRFLHPPPHFPYLGNEASCVLRVETVGGAILLTGDIGHVIERDLMHRDPASIHAEIVLVAHHGSAGSSDPGFVAATGAAIAPMSAGYANRFKHPKPEVLDLWQRHGAKTPVTAAGGALRMRIGLEGVMLDTERGRHRRLWDAAIRRANADVHAF